MKNWVMLNMLYPLQATLFFFFTRRCLQAGMYKEETTLFLFDCIKIKPKQKLILGESLG